MLVAGLAPAAHGANRTGRVFTGDRSGDFLYASLFRTGFANQPTSIAADDGLELARPLRHRRGALRAAGEQADARRSATPACPTWSRELDLLDAGAGDRGARCVRLRGRGPGAGRGRITAADAAPEVRLTGVEVPTARAVVLGCFHPSQQNTFTGKLTEPMIDEVFLRARELADGVPSRP